MNTFTEDEVAEALAAADPETFSGNPRSHFSALAFEVLRLRAENERLEKMIDDRDTSRW